MREQASERTAWWYRHAAHDENALCKSRAATQGYVQQTNAIVQAFRVTLRRSVRFVLRSLACSSRFEVHLERKHGFIFDSCKMALLPLSIRRAGRATGIMFTCYGQKFCICPLHL